MYQRVLWLGLVGISAVVMFANEAFAQRIIGGTLFVKGVRCEYEATGVGGRTLTTGVCDITNVTQGLLFCLNPANRQVDGEPAARRIEFIAGTGLRVADKKGRASYDVISNAAGVIDPGEPDPDAACDASPECADLRRSCVSANWVPIDVVPINMCAVLNVYQCPFEGPCPCDPAGAEPRCVDANALTPEVDPVAKKTLRCTLPNPDTFEVGDPYECSQVAACQ